MISLEKKFIFVHIPKTGGNAIQLVLAPYAIDEIVFNKQQAAFNESVGEVHRFGIRNPHMELRKHSTIADVSAQWKEELLGSWNEYFKFTVVRNPWERLVSYYFSPNLNRTRFDREEFLDFVKSDQVKPQFDFLSINGTVAMDRLVRFESVEREFSELCQRFGIEGNLTAVNESQHDPYPEYYDRELIETVNHYHRKDIDLLGYTYNE